MGLVRANATAKIALIKNTHRPYMVISVNDQIYKKLIILFLKATLHFMHATYKNNYFDRQKWLNIGVAMIS